MTENLDILIIRRQDSRAYFNYITTGTIVLIVTSDPFCLSRFSRPSSDGKFPLPPPLVMSFGPKCRYLRHFRPSSQISLKYSMPDSGIILMVIFAISKFITIMPVSNNY